MTPRALLAGGGAALAVSLFLPWFDGVSGWEHWAWADVPFAVLAAVLVAAAVRPLAGLRAAAVVLAGLGIAVVLGHGFAPATPARTADEVGGDVLAGAYVALAALAGGAIGGLSTWPRRGGPLLLGAGAVGLVAALLSGWGNEEGVAVFFGRLDDLRIAADYDNGFERWRVLDVALLALAVALPAAGAMRRLPLVAHAVLVAAALAGAACVAIGMRGQLWVDEGIAYGAAKGPLVALLALAAAVAGLLLVRPRGRAARAGGTTAAAA